MAYVKTTWQDGDVITADKLNNMEGGIEDAFVAPEVTAADQGKVLTVDSSGDWDAAAPAADKYVLTGKIETSDMSTYTFTLLTGDVSDISINEEVYIRASVEVGGGKLSDVILPLTSTNVDANGEITYYSFPVVVSVGIMGILFFEVRYNTPPEDPTHKYWSASVTQLTS